MNKNMWIRTRTIGNYETHSLCGRSQHTAKEQADTEALRAMLRAPRKARTIPQREFLDPELAGMAIGIYENRWWNSLPRFK